MALARSRRGDSGMNYWPGFVDALSTLILSIIFILTVFVVVQFYLQQEVAGKDTALNRLNAQIAELTELLSMEKSGKSNLQEHAQLQATLSAAQSDPRQVQGACRRRQCRGRQGAGPGVGALRPDRQPEEDFRHRAVAGRNPQPADRGAAPPTRRHPAGARYFGKERPGIHMRASPILDRASIWRWRRRYRS